MRGEGLLALAYDVVRALWMGKEPIMAIVKRGKHTWRDCRQPDHGGIGDIWQCGICRARWKFAGRIYVGTGWWRMTTPTFLGLRRFNKAVED